MNKFTLDNAGNYGEVRSVNGIKPDEHGNVEVAGGGAKKIYFYGTTQSGKDRLFKDSESLLNYINDGSIANTVGSDDIPNIDGDCEYYVIYKAGEDNGVCKILGKLAKVTGDSETALTIKMGHSLY